MQRAFSSPAVNGLLAFHFKGLGIEAITCERVLGKQIRNYQMIRLLKNCSVYSSKKIAKTAKGLNLHHVCLEGLC